MLTSAFVYFSSFVCWQDRVKTVHPIFLKFGRKVAHGDKKETIRFR